MTRKLLRSCNWELFNELANEFQIRPGYAIQALQYLDTELSDAGGTARVADIGAGTGIFTRQLADYLSNAGVIVGIEPSDAMRTIAAKQPSTMPIEYIAGSAERLPLPDAPYDAITAANAVHRFDRPIFFNSIPGILRPGGLIAFLDNLPHDNLSKLHDDYLTLQEKYAPAFRRGMNTDGGTGGYAFLDLVKELREHGGFGDIKTLKWNNDHYVDETTFVTLSHASTINLRIVEDIGKAEFDAKIRKIYRDAANSGSKTELTFITKLVVARLPPG
ncbi:class I SAM-dependent methyltransferase [Bradyrhizobium genosp. A]|uniref:class I SAM-dependent methyltransferase n=1 Tax=Bradyrhizobium genosp. A TaxID=83626 RepID=UPI003CEF5BB8